MSLATSFAVAPTFVLEYLILIFSYSVIAAFSFGLGTLTYQISRKLSVFSLYFCAYGSALSRNHICIPEIPGSDGTKASRWRMQKICRPYPRRHSRYWITQSTKWSALQNPKPCSDISRFISHYQILTEPWSELYHDFPMQYEIGLLDK